MLLLLLSVKQQHSTTAKEDTVMKVADTESEVDIIRSHGQCKWRSDDLC